MMGDPSAIVLPLPGMEYALLGVDAENPTGAYGVYDELGFSEQRREVMVSRAP